VFNVNIKMIYDYNYCYNFLMVEYMILMITLRRKKNDYGMIFDLSEVHFIINFNFKYTIF
jgi:hypothetical protein